LNQIWIYDQVSIDVEEIIDLDDRALGITRFHGLPADGPPVDWPLVPPRRVQRWSDQPGAELS
jgi:hypothetical protein